MKDLINMFKQKGYLLAPELLQVDSSQLKQLYSSVKLNPFKLKILDSSSLVSLQSYKPELGESFKTSVEVVKSFVEEPEKRVLNRFVEMYNDRFEKISELLKRRQELSNVTSARNINEEQRLQEVSFIGMVSDLSYTKNNNLIVTLEDPTGTVRVMITEKDAELYRKAQDVVLDEVIGITGAKSRGYVFANNLFFPDIPTTYEFKKSPDEVYAAFISDIHVGSIDFMEEAFVKFIDWVNGKAGSPEQREISKKLGYLFIVGDVIDGVGIYPSQEKDLIIKDFYEQFKVFCTYIKKIPKRVQVIICPGNHDGVRLAEPQPAFSRSVAEELYDMKNVTLVSNPAYINIHAINGFPGLTVLMYHGYSFDHYCLDVQSLRNAGGYGSVDKVIEFLLKKRHLAPTHGSSLFVPSSKDDMIVDVVPDVVVTGHIHNFKASVYNHINVIACSCFQRLTGETYAERLGHTPTPGLVPLLNLKNRKISVMNFN
jgi:DNA polymerase II small subunit